MHDNAKAFYQDETLARFVKLLDDLLGKPNPINTGTAPYSNTNGLIRLRAKEIVKICALRPWANLGSQSNMFEKFNTIDHIFKRLQEIATENWLVRKQYKQLTDIIPFARAALKKYYKKTFSYDEKLAEKYIAKNLEIIICSYFNFDR